MKKIKQVILPISLCIPLVAASGCSSFSQKRVSADELSKAYARNATESCTVTDEFKNSFTDFSLELFQKSITRTSQNNLLSPLSAAMCLALVNNGAGGNTRAQLEALFGMNTDALNRALYAYTNSLYTEKNCKLSLANSIWMKEDELEVKPSFLQTNADWFGAQAYAAPFDQRTVTDINNWCYNKTTGKINKILDNIPADAVMYLLNAVDFDAKWLNAYERKDIEDGTFHGYNGTDSDVTMLYSLENRYILDENAVGFTRPYIGNQYSFMALLPDEGVDIYEYIDSLSAEKWQAFLEPTSYEYRVVHARIPEFSYETDFSLKESLQALGVTDMFSRYDADFTGIHEENELYCYTLQQKAIIELDRNGTKAAAITMAGIGCKGTAPAPSEPLYITLDRPFVYAIIDNTHKLPIFLGAVAQIK